MRAASEGERPARDTPTEARDLSCHHCSDTERRVHRAQSLLHRELAGQGCGRALCPGPAWHRKVALEQKAVTSTASAPEGTSGALGRTDSFHPGSASSIGVGRPVD